jgi:hypothetical protein
LELKGIDVILGMD